MRTKIKKQYLDETLKLLRNFNMLTVNSSGNKNLSIIKKAIATLPEEQQQVIIERFINNRDWIHVSFETNFSESWCKKLCNKAIDSISIALFGFEAYAGTK